MKTTELKLFNEEDYNQSQLKNAEINVKELMDKNPTRKELAMYLCAMAEHSMLTIEGTPEWSVVNKYELFESSEFKVDLTDVEKANAIGEVGQARWEYVGNDN